MQQVVIRQAAKEDLAAVQRLSQELFEVEHPRDPLLNMEWSHQKEGEDHFRSRVTGEKGICFVAEIEGKVVGYATASVLDVPAWRPVKRIEMENLIITSEYRGQKIGEQLVRRLCEWGKSMGAQRVMVSAYAANDSAIRFYKRIGFIPDSLQLEMPIEK